MKLTITRIELRIVTCELEDGTLIDVARKGDVIEFDVTKCKT